MPCLLGTDIREAHGRGGRGCDTWLRRVLRRAVQGSRADKEEPSEGIAPAGMGRLQVHGRGARDVEGARRMWGAEGLSGSSRTDEEGEDALLPARGKESTHAVTGTAGSLGGVCIARSSDVRRIRLVRPARPAACTRRRRRRQRKSRR